MKTLEKSNRNSKEQPVSQPNKTAAIIAQILDNKHQIASLEQQNAELEDHLLKTHEPGNYPAGDYTLTITKPSRRLNTRKLAADFPAMQYPQLYKQTIDTKRVREAFAETYLETRDYYTTGKSQVRIK